MTIKREAGAQDSSRRRFDRHSGKVATPEAPPRRLARQSARLIVSVRELDTSDKTTGKVRYIGRVFVDLIWIGTHKGKAPHQEAILVVRALCHGRTDSLETGQHDVLIRVEGDRVGAGWQRGNIQITAGLSAPKRKACSYAKARCYIDQRSGP